jgi:O-antigen biosynthesis protein
MRFEKVTNSIPAQLATSPCYSSSSGVAAPIARPQVRGKFIFVGSEKLYIRGVTYGTFHPDAAGNFYPSPEIVAGDFAAMVTNKINAVRTYTVPPRWLLDLAAEYGLWVMVGLPWEQHIAFLDDRKRVRAIEQRIRASVRSCAEHPALLCYVIGNEIPAGIVRWYGRHRVERFLERLYRIAKREDPYSLVTYVNYPTTEYLQLRFIDFVCFNVYLEQQSRLAAYIARLQNLAGDRPLLIAELGLDSRRNGKQKQAEILDWQIRTTFASGCAGAFVFAWTDEWYRGGYDIDDWDFGLTDRQRRPKPALTAVRQAFAQVPLPADLPFPTISVVVCSYNGSRTIRQCLARLAELEYPRYETIVVDDGSTDKTAAIASEYDVRLIRIPQSGLSNARNVGMQAAQGDIIAYIDDDAYPDPHWLTYLAITLMQSSHAGVGGPNLPPPEDGWVAQCVANAPGGPSHVLLSDQEAEHIPGCNMAFRKSCLEAIAGFDPQFRTAGDDVDICWRLQNQGWTIGFSPAAVVWHHRRNSVWRYWKQQQGYGKAEALLEQKWPDKYNILGHLTWSGRIYGPSVMYALSVQERVFYGTWGSALFQSLYQPVPGTLRTLLLMPEWYLVVLALVGLSLLGFFWTPLWLVLPLTVVAVVVTLVQAGRCAARATFPSQPKSRCDRWRRYSLTAVLYLLQPLARLKGRFRYGLQPWRWYGMANLVLPIQRISTLWSTSWRAPEGWLTSIETAIQAAGHRIQRGGNFDRWDLEVPGGLFGSTRLLMAIEEHGSGQQLVRLRTWSRWSRLGWMLVLLFVGLTVGASLDRVWSASAKLGAIALLLLVRSLYECAVASAVVLEAIEQVKTVGGE